MKPREIEVHIDELVLHGFAPNERWTVADALQEQLRGLLVERGLPESWLASPARIDAGEISLTKAATSGGQIADAIYRGGKP